MANLLILAVHPPGDLAGGICGGFVLTSDSGDQCEVAFRRDWELTGFVNEDDADVLNAMEATFIDIAAHKSVEAFVAHVETTYSNLIRTIDSIKLHSDLPLNHHALLLRSALLGAALPAVEATRP